MIQDRQVPFRFGVVRCQFQYTQQRPLGRIPIAAFL
jgi:hypothetical protein